MAVVMRIMIMMTLKRKGRYEEKGYLRKQESHCSTN